MCIIRLKPFRARPAHSLFPLTLPFTSHSHPNQTPFAKLTDKSLGVKHEGVLCASLVGLYLGKDVVDQVAVVYLAVHALWRVAPLRRRDEPDALGVVVRRGALMVGGLQVGLGSMEARGSAGTILVQ